MNLSKEKRNDKIIQLAQAGTDIKTIAHIHGISECQTKIIIKKAGIPTITAKQKQKEERNEKIIQLFKEGYKCKTIAQMFGFTRERIRQILIKGGFFKPQKKEELKERNGKIIQLAKEGYDSQTIADIHGITKIQIQNIITKAGVLTVTAKQKQYKEREEKVIPLFKKGYDYKTIAKMCGIFTHNIYPILKKYGLSSKRRGKKSKYSEEYLLNRLRNIAKQLGKTPSQTDMDKYKPSSNTFVYRFGKFSNAIKLAGLKTENKIERNEKIIQLFKEGYDYKTIAQMYNMSMSNIGLILNKNGLSNKRGKYSKEYLLTRLKDLAKQLGKTPNYTDLNKYKPNGNRFTYHFGKFSNAIKLAGLKPNTNHRDK